MESALFLSLMAGVRHGETEDDKPREIRGVNVTKCLRQMGWVGLTERHTGIQGRNVLQMTVPSPSVIRLIIPRVSQKKTDWYSCSFHGLKSDFSVC